MSGPQGDCSRRLELHESRLERLDRLDLRLANGRLAAIVLLGVLLWLVLISQTLSWAWLVPAVGALGAIVVTHGRVIRERGRRRLARRFYRRALARLDGDWSDPVDDGSRFLPDDHAYARDLDLFGPGSLYAMLCTANSLPGRKTLADWLLRPAAVDVLVDRQEAVEELAGALDFQEELAVCAADLSPQLTVSELSAWGRAPRSLEGLAWPALALLVGLVNTGAVFSFFFGSLDGKVLLAVLGVGAALAQVVRPRVQRVLGRLAALPAAELRFLSLALARLELERFQSGRLRELQKYSGDDAWDAERARPPSEALAQLAALVEWNDSRRNDFFAPLSLLLHFGTQVAFAVERWRGQHGAEVGAWLEAVGEVEALSALATFRYENPSFVFPDLFEGPPRFEGSSLVHPLLARETRVANDVRLGSRDDQEDVPPQLLLVSGSNMSGKSTLLRTVGVSAVLAFTGAPVPARRLRLSPLAIGASLQVHDSLLEGVSRFYAELRQLSRVRELAAEGPTLFLLDEILGGTNSHDRRVGASGVIRWLLETGAVGLVTTHDLALSAIADEVGERAVNVHFEDHLEDGRMAFDYVLQPGVLEQGNALGLMKSLGLPVESA